MHYAAIMVSIVQSYLRGIVCYDCLQYQGSPTASICAAFKEDIDPESSFRYFHLRSDRVVTLRKAIHAIRPTVWDDRTLGNSLEEQQHHEHQSRIIGDIWVRPDESGSTSRSVSVTRRF